MGDSPKVQLFHEKNCFLCFLASIYDELLARNIFPELFHMEKKLFSLQGKAV